MFENYILHLVILVAIYIILALGLNLALGFGGMVNLAIVAFYAIGAYTSALLALKLHAPFALALLAAALMAGLFGYLLSFPTVKLRGDYLVLGTLGFTIIVEVILKNWMQLTRGPLGIPGIPRPEILGVRFSTLPLYAGLVIAVAAIVFLLLRAVVRSPYGRVLKAIRDDEVAARALGKDVRSVKARALTLSAAIAGVAGSLYAHYLTFIDPSTFGIAEVVFVLSIVLIGGAGSIWGSVAGAVLLVLLPEPLRFLPIPSDLIGGLRQGIYALLLVLVVLFRPQGLIGEDTLHRPWKDRKVRA
jgi:branched-chain amino acid transport system permease protein